MFFGGDFSSVAILEFLTPLPYFKLNSFVHGFFTTQANHTVYFNLTDLYRDQIFCFKSLSCYPYLNNMSFSYELTNTEVLG